MTTSDASRREFVRFLLVGGTGALLFVVLSTAILKFTAFPPSAVSIGVHAGLIPVMFMTQRSYTFRSRGPFVIELAKYALLQIASISASTLLLARFATDDWRINAVVFTTISATASLISFIICRFAIFSRSTSAPMTSN